MIEFFRNFGENMTLPVARYALIAGILIAFCASLLGVTLVLKRFSFIGDGLSHVAFGAMAIAAAASVTNQMFIVLPVTVASAVIILRTSRNARIKGDASIALLSIFALAFGYFLMTLRPSSGNLTADVCTSLFGTDSIFRISSATVWMCAGLAVVMLTIFVIFYNRIFSVTFDEPFAKATGVRTEVYNTLIAIIIAVVIVFAMNIVGSLLVSALIIFPALASMRLFKSFRAVTISSILFSIVTAFIGLLLCIGLEDLPLGPTIVLTQTAAFGIFYVIDFLKRKIRT